MIFSKRRTIGVFVSKMFKVFDEAFFAALDRETKRLDCNMVVFVSAGYYLSTSDYDIQEKNIINFFPLDKLDGIIAVPSTYEKGEFRDLIFEMLERKKADCPVVLVRDEEERFNCTFTDNAAAFRGLVRHLIEHHGLTRICMQAGLLQESPEAVIRTEAFRLEMAAHGLEVTEEQICPGNMWTSSGNVAYNAFFSDPERIPQAVVCANDYMAMGLIRELNRHGYRVPEDVMVAGFDNITDWCPDVPSLTTIQPDYQGMVTKAADLLSSLMDRKTKQTEPVRIGLPGVLVLGESCGCGKRDEGFFRRTTEKAMALLEAENDQDAALNNMSIDLGACEDLKEMHQVLVHRRTLNAIVRDQYICLFGTADRLMDESADQACLVHAYRDHRDAGMPMINFDRRDLLPPMADRDDEPQVFYFKLLHQMGHNFGYAVFHYDPGCFPSRCFVQTNALFSIALQNIYRRREMMALYEERRLSSITDPLTGLLNRRGMLEFVEPVWPFLQDREIAFICIDMDGLKQINDNYGHAAGDYAICLTARAVKRVLPEGAAGVRIGGDEFVIFLPDAGDGAAEHLVSRFRKALADLNREEKRTFDVTASAGFAIVRPGRILTIEECIRASDRELYQIKAKHHSE